MTTILKILSKPRLESSIHYSAEELEELTENTQALKGEIDSQFTDITRTIELNDALEELAVVADSISNVTEAEARLIELGGNMAVAGTTVSPESVIPAMEGFVGGAISLEAFDLKEKILKIWQAIKKAIATLWEKIVQFIEQSNVLANNSLKRLLKLEAFLKDHKGYNTNDARMNLDVNKSVDHILTLNDLSTHFKSVLNDGEHVITNPTEVTALLGKSVELYKAFFDTYAKRLIAMTGDITKGLGKVTVENAPEESQRIAQSLKSAQPKLFATLTDYLYQTITAQSKHIKMGQENQNGLARVQFNSKILGAPVFVFTQPLGAAELDVTDYMDRLKLSKVTMAVRSADSFSDARDLDKPYTYEEMQQIVARTIELLKEVVFFKRKGVSKALVDCKNQIREATDKLVTTLAQGSDPDKASAAQPLLLLNLAYANWTRYPMADMVTYAIKVERTISWLIRQNLEFYTHKDKKE